MALHADQRLISWQILVAVPFQLAFVWIGYSSVPLPESVGSTVADRVVYALQWDLYAALVLLAGIGTIGFLRFGSDTGRDGREGDERINRHVRFTRNTHEQLALLLVGHLVLATVIAPEQMRIIPVLVLLFVVARVIYWVGYYRNPMHRTFGFVSTFYPNIAVLAYDAWRVTLG